MLARPRILSLTNQPINQSINIFTRAMLCTIVVAIAVVACPDKTDKDIIKLFSPPLWFSDRLLHMAVKF